MNKEFIAAMEQLEKEKHISKDLLLEAIELALVSAYKKNYGTSQNVRVHIDGRTGDIEVWQQQTVVETVENDLLEISLQEARAVSYKYELEDVIEKRVIPKNFGRIAAQTAKQVVVQRIREAERDMVYDYYYEKIGEILNGVVQRTSNDNVYISVGTTEGILAATEQVYGEVYTQGSRMKVYVMDVKKTVKGTHVYLSRSHPGLVKRLFELEVAEIDEGVVEIRSIAREAGYRTKMAVAALDSNVDPVGACVGGKGMRVQTIVDELFGEKIDITEWSEDPASFIIGALNPAKVEAIVIEDEANRSSTAIVPDHQLSLAIGKEGQNVRLAAKLTGWKIDIRSHSQYYADNQEEIYHIDDDAGESQGYGEEEYAEEGYVEENNAGEGHSGEEQPEDTGESRAESECVKDAGDAEPNREEDADCEEGDNITGGRQAEEADEA